ncbi:substrate-binding periplasmic protein [Pseudomonas luteola]|uniref:substrate-binding periplasmic protein n=1 Tax=Pseudomonas luteola TaxID=47886 RepID=UPI00123C0156|nr:MULTISPECIES: transporter substrate-binding domain-containing protein [Pseudomonas]QEU31128.1 transporter substrate-binding domain-containing protein [Pseudomonas luteola]
MRVLTFCCLALTWSCSLLAWASPPLRLVGNHWEPYVMTSPAGQGLAVDIVRTALGRSGYETTFREEPWERVLYGIQNGSHDVIVDIWYAPERERLGQFSKPFLANRLRFISLKTRAITFSTLEDLRPYRLAVVRGYAYSKEFDQDRTLDKVAVADFEQALRMLLAGRVDLAIEEEHVARRVIERVASAQSSRLQFLDKPLAEKGLHMLVSEDHPEQEKIIAQFDDTIERMKADGTYADIFARYDLAWPPTQQVSDIASCHARCALPDKDAGRPREVPAPAPGSASWQPRH